MTTETLPINEAAGERKRLVRHGGPVSYVTTCRFQLSMLAFSCTLCVYLLRASMSVAIVCMTYDPDAVNHNISRYLQGYNNTGYNSTALIQTTAATMLAQTDSDSCPPVEDDVSLADINHQDVFPWSRQLRGWVLSAYYIGYIITQIPSGWVATKCGTKWPLFASMMTCSVLSMLTPLVARWSVYLLMVVQVAKGMVSGMHYPLFYHMIGVWSPPFERSFMVAMLFSGAPVGTIISSVLSGYLCRNGFDGGWPSIFYVFGIMGVVISLLWVFLAYDRPEDHPRISDEEKELLTRNAQPTKGSKTTKPVPWRLLLTTCPLYAVFITNICYAWGWFVVLSSLPQYLSDVLRFNIKQNGLYFSIPYLANWILSLIASFIADAMAKREIVSNTVLRKIFETLGLLPSAAFAVGVAFLSSCHDRALPVVLLSLWVGFLGFTRSGADCTQMELAPAFAGLVMGIDQTLTSIMGIIAPPVVAMLTKTGTHEEWQVVFFITAGVFMLGCLTFLLFSSSEEQEWAKGEPTCVDDAPCWALDVTSGRAVTKQGRIMPSINSVMKFIVSFCLWDMPYR